MADLKETLQELNNTKDTTGEYDPQDINDNKLLACLSYISWLVLIPLFCAKDSKFARFHVNQGLVLAIAETAIIIVLSILGAIPLLGVIFRIVRWILNIVFAVFSVIGVLNALSGKAKELPLIGSLKVLK